MRYAFEELRRNHHHLPVFAQNSQVLGHPKEALFRQQPHRQLLLGRQDARLSSDRLLRVGRAQGGGRGGRAQRGRRQLGRERRGGPR